ncbi:extracellular matrix regulator RemB [Bacillus massilinigeriensis]|uniref:extracellular matrix regulator RemB n=1 Tax=Bacillus massilionigeriensis TaxID=1805475 RepID=UPI00096AED01|nr:extracellular matrix/biofilm biosynthesis regulator RemA family protein [Bacillus massilionigeriensis]
MFVHVGEDVLVNSKEIVAILNKNSFHSMNGIQDFYSDKLCNLSKGAYKSIVVTGSKIYLSPFASGKIMKSSR